MKSFIESALSSHEAYDRSLALGCSYCQRQYLLEETNLLLRALMLCYEKLNGLGITETRDLNQLKNGLFPL